MHQVVVWTDTPINHAQRALDELERLGFALESLSVKTSGHVASIRIAYSGQCPMRAATFFARLARIPGVQTAEPAANI